MQNIKLQLENELDSYMNGNSEFMPYYEGMNIFPSNLYKKQLKEILKLVKEKNESDVKIFEMYLDTVIINMHTKAKKYKQSIYFNNENIKDIPHEDFTIVFMIDELLNNYLILAILPKELSC